MSGWPSCSSQTSHCILFEEVPTELSESFIKVQIPFMRALLSWTIHLPITPHILIRSHWAIEYQHINFEGPQTYKCWERVKAGEGMTEGKMVRWHHRLSGHEFEQAPGAGYRQGSLVCCRPWGCKDSDTAEWLNNNNRHTDYTPCLSTSASWYCFSD